MDKYIDISKTFGEMFLIDSEDWFQFKNNKKTDVKLGSRAVIVLPEHSFEKIKVKVQGIDKADIKKLITESKQQFLNVKLVDAVCKAYVFNNKMILSVEAKDVQAVA